MSISTRFFCKVQLRNNVCSRHDKVSGYELGALWCSSPEAVSRCCHATCHAFDPTGVPSAHHAPGLRVRLVRAAMPMGEATKNASPDGKKGGAAAAAGNKGAGRQVKDQVRESTSPPPANRLKLAAAKSKSTAPGSGSALKGGGPLGTRPPGPRPPVSAHAPLPLQRPVGQCSRRV